MITTVVGSIISFSKYSKDKVIENYFSSKRYKDEFTFSGDKGFVGCSDPYWNLYKLDRFYFSFPRLPIWIGEVVKELNSQFENVKVNIFRNETVTCPTGNIPVFSVNYSKKYPREFRKYCSIMMHHIFRLFSYGENIIGNHHIKDSVGFLSEKERPKESVLTTIKKLNNIHKNRYRKLCEVDISEDDILNLNDIQLIKDTYNKYHSIFSNGCRQSDIILSLREMKEKGEIIPKFKLNDKVRMTEYSRASWGDYYSNKDVAYNVIGVNIHENPLRGSFQGRDKENNNIHFNSMGTFYFEKIEE